MTTQGMKGCVHIKVTDNLQDHQILKSLEEEKKSKVNFRIKYFELEL